MAVSFILLLTIYFIMDEIFSYFSITFLYCKKFYYYLLLLSFLHYLYIPDHLLRIRTDKKGNYNDMSADYYYYLDF
jgi:hypothetical protein